MSDESGRPATLDRSGRRIRRPEWVAHVLDEPSLPTERPQDDAPLVSRAGSQSGEPSAAHAVLLHLPRGQRVALSDTATRIWQLIVDSGEAGVSISHIAETLAVEYSVDPAIVDRDATTLVQQLLAGDWVELVLASEG